MVPHRITSVDTTCSLLISRTETLISYRKLKISLSRLLSEQDCSETWNLSGLRTQGPVWLSEKFLCCLALSLKSLCSSQSLTHPHCSELSREADGFAESQLEIQTSENAISQEFHWITQHFCI